VSFPRVSRTRKKPRYLRREKEGGSHEVSANVSCRTWDSHELATEKKFPDGRPREIATSSRRSSRLRETSAGMTMKTLFAPEPLLAVLRGD